MIKRNIPKMLKDIRKKLKSRSRAEMKQKLRKQHGERVPIYGVKPSVRNELISKYYRHFKARKDVEGAFFLAESLVKTKTFEETAIGVGIFSKLSKWFSMHAFWRLERMLDYMNTAYNTDMFCSKVLSPILKKYKHETKYIYHWADSTNRWRRRAAALILLDPIKSGKDVTAGFVMAKKIRGEKNLDVLEAFEILLKALKKADRKKLKKFMVEHERKIPRYIVEELE